MANGKRVRCIFSDLDGTLCHFTKDTSKHGIETTEDKGAQSAVVRNSDGEERRCRLLPASTMGSGAISMETIELVNRLRAEGIKFVIVSGARTTTLIERMPLLCQADAIACETGAKILYPPPGVQQPCPPREWQLDDEWATRFENVTGGLAQTVPPAEREGALWDLFRELVARGVTPDARGYSGCFRVNATKNPNALPIIEEIVGNQTRLAEMGLAHAMNLGMHDFFPALAGKGNVVKHLQAKWGLDQDECIALFDDDNDLPMAAECGSGYLPGITSKSVSDRVATEKTWTLSPKAGSGVFATEEILQRILQQVMREKEDPSSN